MASSHSYIASAGQSHVQNLQNVQHSESNVITQLMILNFELF